MYLSYHFGLHVDLCVTVFLKEKCDTTKQKMSVSPPLPCFPHAQDFS